MFPNLHRLRQLRQIREIFRVFFLDLLHELRPERARHLEPRRALQRVHQYFILGILEGAQHIVAHKAGIDQRELFNLLVADESVLQDFRQE
jgi:hypothetical protein